MSSSITDQLTAFETQTTLLEEELEQGGTSSRIITRIIEHSFQPTVILGQIPLEDSSNLRARVTALAQGSYSLLIKALEIHHFSQGVLTGFLSPEEKERCKELVISALDHGHHLTFMELSRHFKQDPDFLLTLLQRAHRNDNPSFIAFLKTKISFDPLVKQQILQAAFHRGDDEITALIQTHLPIEESREDFLFMTRLVDNTETLPADGGAQSAYLDYFLSCSKPELRDDFRHFCILRKASLRDLEFFEQEMLRISPISQKTVELITTCAFLTRQDDLLRRLARLPNACINLLNIVLRFPYEHDHRQRLDLILDLFPDFIRRIDVYCQLLAHVSTLQNGELLDRILHISRPSSEALRMWSSTFFVMSLEFGDRARSIFEHHIEIATRREFIENYLAYGLTLTFEEVHENPLRFLSFLAEGGLPPRINLSDSPAYDAGGLYKEFVSTLVAALHEKKLFKINQYGIPSLEAEDQERIKFYQALGSFLSKLLEINIPKRDKILTGFLFDSTYFEIIKTFFTLVKEARLESLPNPVLASLVGILSERDDSWGETLDILKGAKDLSEEQQEAYKEKVIAFAECTADVDKEGKTLEEIQALKFEAGIKAARERVFAVLRPAQVLYENASDDLKQYVITSDDSVSLAEKIQGVEASSEDLIDMISAQHEFEPGSEQALYFESQIEWLTEKIRLSSPEWRKEFIKAITGSSTITKAKTIQITGKECIEGRPADLLAEIHTCFNSLDLFIPSSAAQRPSKEAFLISLEALLDGGYNTN